MKIQSIVLMTLCLTAALAVVWLIQPKPPAPKEETGSGEVAIGGDFTLINQDGETVTNATFADHYRLIYFGFTMCPDICPVSLQIITNAVEALPPEEAVRVIPMFASIDPERDTPEVIKAYLEPYHPRFVGLTGDKAQVNVIKKSYKVYASKVTEQDLVEGYYMDHSGFLYLISPEGKYLAHFTQETPVSEIVTTIQEELNKTD